MEKLRAHSPDLTARSIERIAGLFPGVITEGRDGDGNPVRAVDFDLLRQELSGHLTEGPRERYQLDWPGKRAAFLAASAPVARTLRPVRDESVDFDTTRNIVIEGDSLDALKLLQESYLGKVKLIYIDPPYNTGSDFVYADDFAETTAEYLARSGQTDADGTRLVANTEASGRFHSDWLSMMYPRLKLARNLLTDDGAIFVSIDSTEHANLIKLLSEIMGEDNFRADITWQKRYTRSNNTRDFAAVVENIVVFSRSDQFAVNLLPRTAEADARYANPDADPRGPWKGASFLNPATAAQRPNLCYEIRNPNTGQATWPSTNAWRRSRAEFERLAAEGLLYWGTDGKSPVPSVKMFLSAARGLTPTNFWSHEYAGNTDEGTRDLAALLPGKIFDNPKPMRLMKRVLEHATDKSSLVLDFFAGSGTMAQAVLELNAEDGGTRRFIAVQLPERCAPGSAAARAGFGTVTEICKARLRRAGSTAPPDTDAGFRVLRADSTNMTDVLRLPGELAQGDAGRFAETVKPDRTPEDVLFEVLARSGLELSAPVKVELIDGRDVFVVADGALIACLARDVSLPVVREIAHRAPSRAVFLDSAFAADADRVSAWRIFAGVSPATDLLVI
ncbi:MAG TPA: site-specific DNA-methyltransferase [Trebonia sp.]